MLKTMWKVKTSRKECEHYTIWVKILNVENYAA